MHGVFIRDKKVLSESEKSAERESWHAASLLLQSAITNKKEKVFTSESFKQTTELLKLNPELGFAWNFRRLILVSTADDTRLASELSVLTSIIIELQMTKSYCIWNHRKWVLKRMQQLQLLNEKVLESEKIFISEVLKLDSRNFHCWAFRQFLESQMNVEFDIRRMSADLIDADFSCYSAWHIRKRVEFTNEDEISQELSLIWNAIFTEPNDQSVWQYHDWFVEKYSLSEQELEYLQELESILEDKDKKYLLLWKLKSSSAPKNECVALLKQIDPMRTEYYKTLE